MKVSNSTIHLFSSGSTGKAKCIVHRLQHFLINASVANKALSINSESRYLLNLPCFHVSGLSILFRSFLAGACVIKDSDINRAIVTEKVTHMSCVERQLRELLTVGDNKHLEAILLGGGPVHDSVLSQAIEKGFPLYLTYGMTETCSQIAIAHHAKLTPGFTGRLQPHAKAKLSDTKELLIQCDSLFLGYLTETKKGLHKPLTEGYFATGDLAEISDSGEIKILGRLDNMFISNGENIYPEAIESVIKSVSGVTDAVVVSVADRDRSQVPVAFIKADVDIESLSESINAVIKTKLSSLHVPKYRLNYPELKGLKANRKALTSLAIQYQSSL